MPSLISWFYLVEVPRTLHVEFWTSRTYLGIICLFHLSLLSKELDSDGLSRVFSLFLIGFLWGPLPRLFLGHLHLIQCQFIFFFIDFTPFFMVLQPILQECLYKTLAHLYSHKANDLVPWARFTIVIFWISTMLCSHFSYRD